jgi:aspartokinase-like uncharacterized kinase
MLNAWLKSFTGTSILLVPGGGRMADVVRELDATHALGEEQSHWLALRAMTVQAYILAALVPGMDVVDEPFVNSGLAVLDAWAFAVADEKRPRSLPHSWEITSDSLAARVAWVADVDELVLLKSQDKPGTEGKTWEEAANRGFVDPVFPIIIRQDGAKFRVRAVNLRSWQPGANPFESAKPTDKP